MSLKVNAKAPDFQLPSTGNTTFTLSKDAAGEPLILYFYPRDFTQGCTKEACSFRDHFSFFQTANVKVVGISTDPIEVHETFVANYNLPFALLSDIDGSVSKLYKAKVPFLNVSKRVTYLLNKDHVIIAVYSDFFTAENHIKEMMRSLDEA